MKSNKSGAPEIINRLLPPGQPPNYTLHSRPYGTANCDSYNSEAAVSVAASLWYIINNILEQDEDSQFKCSNNQSLYGGPSRTTSVLWPTSPKPAKGTSQCASGLLHLGEFEMVKVCRSSETVQSSVQKKATRQRLRRPT